MKRYTCIIHVLQFIWFELQIVKQQFQKTFLQHISRLNGYRSCQMNAFSSNLKILPMWYLCASTGGGLHFLVKCIAQTAGQLAQFTIGPFALA